jgi:tetratricopeptide (TPR) repeat protein
MKTFQFAVLAAVITLAGCAREAGHTGKGMFNDPAKASTSSLHEAREIDAVQHLVNDGLFDRARKALDQLLAEGSRHPQAFYLKAQLTRQDGDVAGAIPWAVQACEASPSWIEPRILLAQAYLKLERWSAASGVFADIEHLAPKGPWGPYGQGAVAAMRGDHAAAAHFLDTALERDPDHLPSLQTRAQVARIQGDAATEERLLARVAALDPLDGDVRLRLGELAQAAGRAEDAKRQFLRAYELDPKPTTAAKLAALARAANDAEEEHRWNARAGIAPAPPDEAPQQPAVQ